MEAESFLGGCELGDAMERVLEQGAGDGSSVPPGLPGLGFPTPSVKLGYDTGLLFSKEPSAATNPQKCSVREKSLATKKIIIMYYYFYNIWLFYPLLGDNPKSSVY